MGRPAKTANEDLDKFLLRLPTGLRSRIKSAADGNNRSMNSEIVSTLEEAYPGDDFDFAPFMIERMVPILNETNLHKQKIMVDDANDFLSAHGGGIYVSTEKKSDGSTLVTLTIGEIKFRVGEAMELIVM